MVGAKLPFEGSGMVNGCIQVQCDVIPQKPQRRRDQHDHDGDLDGKKDYVFFHKAPFDTKLMDNKKLSTMKLG